MKTKHKNLSNYRENKGWGMILFSSLSKETWQIWSNLQANRKTATLWEKSKNPALLSKRRSLRLKMLMRISAHNLSTSMKKICNHTNQVVTLFPHSIDIKLLLWLGWFNDKDRSLLKMIKISSILYGQSTLLVQIDHSLSMSSPLSWV